MSDGRYDVIVTGAGISGMMAGCFLARAGRRVLVVEANHQAGGLMAGITRKGFTFDVGDQSFEDLGIVFSLLDELGVYEPERWHRSRYQIRMPDVDVVIDSLDAAEHAFRTAFPREARSIARVFKQHRETSALITTLVERRVIQGLATGDPRSMIEFIRVLGLRAPALARLFARDFGDWYREVMAPSGLRDLLSRCGYSRMNVLIASAFWHLWANDYWYPVGGFSWFFSMLAERLRELGGELRCKRRVVKYLHRDGEVRGVETATGERFEATHVIHTGSLHSALELIGEDAFSQRFVKRVRGATMSDSMVSLYLGLDVPPAELRKVMRASHLFYFPSYECGRPRELNDVDYHRSQFLELTAHGLFQDGLAPEGKTAMVVQAFSDIRWNHRWGQEGPAEGMKARYRAEKNRVADQLLDVLEPLLPGVRERIVWRDVGSPESTVRFTSNPLGSTSGFSLHPKDFPRLPALGSFKSPIRNLLLAGHSSMWPGSVPTAALSGKIVADRITRTRR